MKSIRFLGITLNSITKAILRTEFGIDSGIVEVKSIEMNTDKGFEVFQHSEVMNGFKSNAQFNR